MPPKMQQGPLPKYYKPCWELAYSKTAGYDPFPNIANRMWFWREGRSAFGRFETDDDGLFFMRGSAAESRKRTRMNEENTE